MNIQEILDCFPWKLEVDTNPNIRIHFIAPDIDNDNDNDNRVKDLLIFNVIDNMFVCIYVNRADSQVHKIQFFRRILGRMEEMFFPHEDEVLEEAFRYMSEHDKRCFYFPKNRLELD